MNAPIQTIGIAAPSSYVEQDDIERSADVIRARGIDVHIHEQTYARHGQIAGTLEERLAALHYLYADPSIDAIWVAGGGNRALELLGGLDYALIKANPKPLIGFSDTTALLNGIYARTGITNYHAPVFRQLHTKQPTALDALFDLIGGKTPSINLEGADTMRTGDASGVLIGGNLSVFQLLLSLSGCESLCDDAILFLEDCNEELSRVDRMFVHLRASGVFARISGLILGQFTDLNDTGRPFDFSFEECIEHHTRGFHFPILMDAPFGHGGALTPLPVGQHATLDGTQLMLQS